MPKPGNRAVNGLLTPPLKSYVAIWTLLFAIYLRFSEGEWFALLGKTAGVYAPQLLWMTEFVLVCYIIKPAQKTYIAELMVMLVVMKKEKPLFWGKTVYQQTGSVQ